MKLTDIKIGETYAVSSAGGGPRGMGYIDSTLPPVKARVLEIVEAEVFTKGYPRKTKIVKRVRCQITRPKEYSGSYWASTGTIPFDLEPRELTGPWDDAQAAYLADRAAKAPADNAALRLRELIAQLAHVGLEEINCTSDHRGSYHVVNLRLTVGEAKDLIDALEGN